MQPYICPTCGQERTCAQNARGECYPCHIGGVSFNFVGGGSYGRRAFHDHTNAEIIRENLAGVPKEDVAYMGRRWV